jgi:cytoskeletal protein CcmA (bactofilin family)
MISTPKKNPDQAQASNRILSGTAIQGDIQTDGDIRVDGSVIGNMRVSGKLVVGQHGSVEGEIECKNAGVAGSIKGILKVAQTLSLTSSAKLEGTVFTEKLSVEPGATVNGSVSMGAVMKKVSETDSTASKTA